MNKEEDVNCLTEADMDRIAEKAADRALEKVYSDVGKSVTKKFVWLVGICFIGVAIWLASSGNIPHPRIP